MWSPHEIAQNISKKENQSVQPKKVQPETQNQPHNSQSVQEEPPEKTQKETNQQNSNQSQNQPPQEKQHPQEKQPPQEKQHPQENQQAQTETTNPEKSVKNMENGDSDSDTDVGDFENELVLMTQLLN